LNLDKVSKLIDSRKDELYYYSPYSFLRTQNLDKIFSYSVKYQLLDKISDNSISPRYVKIGSKIFCFLLEHLKWDSNYFGFPNYKLHSVLYGNCEHKVLCEAIQSFWNNFSITKGKYCFIEIPSEDIQLIGALGSIGFRLIETRLTYYLNLSNMNNQRFSVKPATIDDIDCLRVVAKKMRNKFDRFHADPIFSQEKADNFLATYIEESINGFADYTIIPDNPTVPSEAFVTAKYLNDEWSQIGAKVSKMVLSAVSPTCKGWYIKLISEMAYHLRDIGADYAFMHPSTTNKKVIHTYEKLGCKLGQATHILSNNS
jgi:dTDP-4-amino-4,6-dideoxy-D-galactose acyltransferase